MLTDQTYFKGSLNDLRQIKSIVNIPVLRKDFIFDPYQVYESKVVGADAILLIASILKQETLTSLVSLTHELDMSCLVETHSQEDIEKALKTDAQVIGINARDLQTFDIDLATIVALAPFIPKDRILVAESGIATPADVGLVKKVGAHGVLVGTTLMQSPDVMQTIHDLIYV